MLIKILLPFLLISNVYASPGEKILDSCQEQELYPYHLEEMLKKNRHINFEIRDEKFNGTPLIWCTATNQWRIVDILLQNGADPNAIDNQNDTALILAAKFNRVNIVKSLIATGAKKTFKDRWGYSAADWALRSGNIKIISMIANKAENLIPWDEKNLKLAYNLITEVSDGKITVDAFKKRFKGFGALIDEPVVDGSTLLHFAAFNGNLPLLRVALEKGASPDIPSKIGNTALMMASSAGQIKIVGRLIRAGADPDIKNKEGIKAIDFAKGNSEISLIEFKNTFKSYEKRKAKLDQNRKKKIVAMLKSYKRATKMRLLMDKHRDEIKKMGEKKRKEETRQKDFVNSQNKGLMDPPWPGPANSRGKSPYMGWAAFNAIWVGNFDRVKYLLNKGLSLNVRGQSGNTLLHLAANKGNQRICDLLVSRGAKINTKNSWGNTPLMLAAKFDHGPTVYYLLKAGANKRIRNKKGWVAARFARQQRNRATFNALKF